MSAKLKEFVVKNTNIADEDGNKRKPGDTIMLTKKSAEHYHALGYIAIPMTDFYGDDDDNKGEAEGSDGEDTEKTVSRPAADSKRSKSGSRIASAAANATN